ncbi:MAG: DUF222 domain-containing protein [Proteobacteria bacterium]|nr:DUF222 domain-containing protein [Pseudomonadota bacterium]
MNPQISPQNRILSIDELDRDIVNLAARINAATSELLNLIRQFDERAGWLKWGLANCAEWLHWRCDLSMSAAREKVRMAHALKTLPLIATAFSNGELSYSKVRPLTRVARADNEESLLAFALKTTASRVEERCRELRCGTVVSLGEANRAHDGRSLRVHRNAGKGTMTITVELPLETGELLEKALDRARDTAASQTPQFVDECWSVQQADALVVIAKAFLSGDGNKIACTSDNYQVTVHVDRSALTNGDGRSSLPIESVKRLCCDGDTVVIVENEDGEPLSVGRKTRTVPTAIKRALYARDKGCVFPGCRHSRFVDAHHIKHWSAGGETSLENLMLLCSRHHRLVHEGGFRIERDYRNRWFFKRPDGRAVPSCGYQAQDMIDDDIHQYVDNNTGELSRPINNPSAEGFLTALKSSSVMSPRP